MDYYKVTNLPGFRVLFPKGVILRLLVCLLKRLLSTLYDRFGMDPVRRSKDTHRHFYFSRPSVVRSSYFRVFHGRLFPEI